MKNFLYRIFLFCIPVIIITIGLEIYVRNIPSQYKQKRDQLVANADSIEILILGSSHAGDDIDPNQFSLYAHNLAFASQSIYFDRKLAEKYLPVLRRLKYVLLTLDFNSLYYDHEENRDFFYKYYYDISYKKRQFYKESLLQSFFVYTPEQTLSMIFNNQNEVLVKGWRNKAGRNDEAVQSMEKSELRANGFNATVNSWKGGDSVLDDLEALINLLQSKNITPILITYPNYSTIRSFMDASVIERTQNIGNSLSQKYHIPYLDYFADDSFTVADFFNCDHLNAEGAAKLSKKINAVIMDRESASQTNK
ncbi:MAG: hypothetical protein FWF52_03765 [Candidatus Azobacteroides sp.]|nr:hypothetical protein [Candidatus Azobacteroides sp.]